MGWAPVFEVAFDVNPLDEPDPEDWTDLSDRLRFPGPIQVSFGSGRLSGGAGCTLTLDNYDRLIDPTNPAATLNLVPMRHARLRVQFDASTVDLVRGYVDAWPPTLWGWDSTVDVSIVDGTALLALQDAPLSLPAQWTHERVEAILDAAGWPVSMRDINPGRVRVEPVDLESANLLRVLQDTADAENGDLHVTSAGAILFTSRHHRFDTLPVVTFGAGGFPILSGDPAYDTHELTNVGRVELDSGDVYEAVDEASVAQFGRRVQPVRDLALRAREANALAQWEVERFAAPHVWLDNVEVDVSEDSDLAAVLDLRVGDTAAVVVAPGEGDPMELTMSVERMQLRLEPGGGSAIFDLSPYFGEGPWFAWDDPTRGWDMGAKWAP